jgi:hypothetical protein
VTLATRNFSFGNDLARNARASVALCKPTSMHAIKPKSTPVYLRTPPFTPAWVAAKSSAKPENTGTKFARFWCQATPSGFMQVDHR